MSKKYVSVLKDSAATPGYRIIAPEDYVYTENGTKKVKKIDSKADKKVPATAGNLATLDSTGNLADSGKQTTDFMNALTTAYEASGSATKTVTKVTQAKTGAVTVTYSDIQSGTTSQKGLVQLENSTSSTSTTTAATPNSVKSAYDLANGKYTKPSGGIPSSDMDSTVQASLGKADTAIQGVKLNGSTLTPSSAKVVDLGNLKTKQTAVSDPSASGTTITAIASISQDANGVITATKKTIQSASQSQDGVMSAADKTKLDGIATGAEVNQNAFSNVKVGDVTVAADTKTDTLTLAAGSNVTITPDATNDKITIAAKDTTYTADAGIRLDGTVFKHTNSVSGGTVGPTTDTAGASLSVPYVTYDSQGHVTASGTRTHNVGTASTSGAGIVQLQDSIDATTTKAATPNAVKKAIEALDVSSVGGSGKYISAISENDGKISATATTMDSTPTAGSEKAVTSGGIKTVLDDTVNVANSVIYTASGNTRAYYKLAETDVLQGYTSAILSCDYMVVPGAAHGERGELVLNFRVKDDTSWGLVDFYARQEYSTVASNYGLQFIYIAQKNSTGTHIDLYVSIASSLTGFILSRRFRKQGGTTLGDEWTFIATPTASSTAPTVPSGASTGTITPEIRDLVTLTSVDNIDNINTNTYAPKNFILKSTDWPAGTFPSELSATECYLQCFGHNNRQIQVLYVEINGSQKIYTRKAYGGTPPNLTWRTWQSERDASWINTGTFGTARIADDAITAAKVKDNETLPVNISGYADTRKSWEVKNELLYRAYGYTEGSVLGWVKILRIERINMGAWLSVKVRGYFYNENSNYCSQPDTRLHFLMISNFQDNSFTLRLEGIPGATDMLRAVKVSDTVVELQANYANTYRKYWTYYTIESFASTWITVTRYSANTVATDSTPLFNTVLDWQWNAWSYYSNYLLGTELTSSDDLNNFKVEQPGGKRHYYWYSATKPSSTPTGSNSCFMECDGGVSSNQTTQILHPMGNEKNTVYYWIRSYDGTSWSDWKTIYYEATSTYSSTGTQAVNGTAVASAISSAYPKKKFRLDKAMYGLLKVIRPTTAAELFVMFRVTYADAGNTVGEYIGTVYTMHTESSGLVNITFNGVGYNSLIKCRFEKSATDIKVAFGFPTTNSNRLGCIEILNNTTPFEFIDEDGSGYTTEQPVQFTVWGNSIGTAIGSAAIPTYVNVHGKVTACTDDFVHDGDVVQTYSSSSTAPISGKGVTEKNLVKAVELDSSDSIDNLNDKMPVTTRGTRYWFWGPSSVTGTFPEEKKSFQLSVLVQHQALTYLTQELWYTDVYNNYHYIRKRVNGTWQDWKIHWDETTSSYSSSGKQPVNGTAVASAISTKADKVSITGATKCKITYNSQGIVTAGADLANTDLPKFIYNCGYTSTRMNGAAAYDSSTPYKLIARCTYDTHANRTAWERFLLMYAQTLFEFKLHGSWSNQSTGPNLSIHPISLYGSSLDTIQSRFYPRYSFTKNTAGGLIIEFYVKFTGDWQNYRLYQLPAQSGDVGVTEFYPYTMSTNPNPIATLPYTAIDFNDVFDKVSWYGNASTASIATNATNDADGNPIKTTYLKLAGGTMSGKLTTQANQYTDDGSNGAIDLRNSNIVGLNSIYTADAAESASEGIHFYRSTANDVKYYDSLWMNSGSILFVPNRAAGTNTSAGDSRKVAILPASITDSQVVLTDGTNGYVKTAAASSLTVGAINRDLGSGSTIAETNIINVLGSTDGVKLTYGTTASNAGYSRIGTFDDGNETLYLGNWISSTFKPAISITNGQASVTGSLSGNATTATTADKLKSYSITYHRPTSVSGGDGKQWARVATLTEQSTLPKNKWYGIGVTVDVYINPYTLGYTYVGRYALSYRISSNLESLKTSGTCYVHEISGMDFLPTADGQTDGHGINWCAVRSDKKIEFFVKNGIWDTEMVLVKLQEVSTVYEATWSWNIENGVYTEDELTEYCSDKVRVDLDRSLLFKSNSLSLRRRSSYDLNIWQGFQSFGVVETLDGNNRPTNHSFYTMTMTGEDTNFCGQVAFRRDGDPGLFMRQKKAGSWGSWSKMVSTLDVASSYSSTGTNPVNGKAVAAAIGGLDVSSVGGDGKYISAISETDGKISATATTMDTIPTPSSTKAVTSGAVHDYLYKNVWTTATQGYGGYKQGLLSFVIPSGSAGQNGVKLDLVAYLAEDNQYGFTRYYISAKWNQDGTIYKDSIEVMYEKSFNPEYDSNKAKVFWSYDSSSRTIKVGVQAYAFAPMIKMHVVNCRAIWGNAIAWTSLVGTEANFANTIIPTSNATIKTAGTAVGSASVPVYAAADGRLTPCTAVTAAESYHLCAYGYTRLWASGQFVTSKPYALLADITIATTGGWGTGQLFKIEAGLFHATFKLRLAGNSSGVYSGSDKVIVLESTDMTETQLDTMIKVTYSFTANSTCIVRIYSDLTLLNTSWQRVTLRQLDNHSGGEGGCQSIWDMVNFYKNDNNANMVASVTGTPMSNNRVAGKLWGYATRAIADSDGNQINTTYLKPSGNAATASTLKKYSLGVTNDKRWRKVCAWTVNQWNSAAVVLRVYNRGYAGASGLATYYGTLVCNIYRGNDTPEYPTRRNLFVDNGMYSNGLGVWDARVVWTGISDLELWIYCAMNSNAACYSIEHASGTIGEPIGDPLSDGEFNTYVSGKSTLAPTYSVAPDGTYDSMTVGVAKKVACTGDAEGTSYVAMLSSNAAGNYALRTTKYFTSWYDTNNGAILELGASGGTKSTERSGHLRLGNGAYKAYILANDLTARRDLYLPDASGKVVVTNRTTAIGNTTNPVYVDASGTIQWCTSYGAATVGNTNNVKVTASDAQTYLTGVTTAPSASNQYLANVANANVYATAGKLHATTFDVNSKCTLQFNSTTNALDFVFT